MFSRNKNSLKHKTGPNEHISQIFYQNTYPYILHLFPFPKNIYIFWLRTGGAPPPLLERRFDAFPYLLTPEPPWRLTGRLDSSTATSVQKPSPSPQNPNLE